MAGMLLQQHFHKEKKMKYIKVINELNRIFPYSDRQFRRDNANVSFPSTISDEIKASYQVYPVIEEPSPVYNEATQRIVRQQPQIVNNQWFIKWSIVDKTEEEKIQYREDQIRKVKAEAKRRIIAIAPEWKQSNMLARALTLLRKGEANLTTAEALEVSGMDEVWTEIQRIRSVSDTLEAVDPPPEDFADDRHWV
jgi:hypothetical protein